ncbi:hypothetical protein EJ03DRAFT_331276 [Teratosphaeria nubilosa]|uniref:Uncharacterized protein n=1 Tax=Teratosphaeria nubilosa TaxID=161662 RepID=A0A6G1KY41_9PEZI|nr:hypothetical protein EJ03DRAFT_331276 [Teratosphaeria nubilosa]
MIIKHLSLLDWYAVKYTCRQFMVVIDSIRMPFTKPVKANRRDSPATSNVNMHPHFFTKAGVETSSEKISRYATVPRKYLPYAMTHKLLELSQARPSSQEKQTTVEVKLRAPLAMQISVPAATRVRVHARGETGAEPRIRDVLVRDDRGLSFGKILRETVREFLQAESEMEQPWWLKPQPKDVTDITIDAIEVLEVVGSQRERRFEYGHYLAVNGSFDGKD